MQGSTILLIAVGLVIIILSYTISEKITENKSNTDEENTGVDKEAIKRILKENEEKFRKSTENILEDKVEAEMGRVDDQLSHLSNEKIMAVSEFSDQILDKIEQNHKEVVFLYDMLNEKENEMKEFVQEIDKSKLVLEELAAKELEKQKALQHKKIQQELEKERKKQERLEREKEDLIKSRIISEEKQEEQLSVAVIEQTQAVNMVERSEEKQEEQQQSVSALERMGNVVESVPAKEMEKEEPIEDKVIPADRHENGNQNQVILDMYNEGKTIMDIAKLLGKGQGEVKLVIDLFQGAKK